MQDDGQGHQEIVPSLLTQDTLNPSHYGIRIIATELEAILDKLTAQVAPAPWLSCAAFSKECMCCQMPSGDARGNPFPAFAQ